MSLRRIFAALAMGVSMTGCAIGSSFSPSAALSPEPSGTAVVVITEADISTKPGARKEFMALSDQVNKSLESRPGYLGSAFRFEVLGTKVWTMTAWTDEQSVNDFMLSEPHQTAISRTFVLVNDGRFARTQIAQADLPLSWDDAMTLLDTQGRRYFE